MKFFDIDDKRFLIKDTIRNRKTININLENGNGYHECKFSYEFDKIEHAEYIESELKYKYIYSKNDLDFFMNESGIQFKFEIKKPIYKKSKNKSKIYIN
jgi:hypothetical protein